MDFVAQLDAFHDFSLTEEMHLRVCRPQRAAIEAALNKELVVLACDDELRSMSYRLFVVSNQRLCRARLIPGSFPKARESASPFGEVPLWVAMESSA